MKPFHLTKYLSFSLIHHLFRIFSTSYFFSSLIMTKVGYSFFCPFTVMNIEWDYNYYQPWSDNEWLVDEMLAMLDEDIIMQ